MKLLTKLLIPLMVLLIPSVALTEGYVRRIGDDVKLYSPSDGSMDIGTSNEFPLNMCTDSADSATCMTLSGVGALAVPGDLTMTSGRTIYSTLGTSVNYPAANAASTAATGSTQADAAQLTGEVFHLITAADATKGARLLDGYTIGDIVFIHNGANAALKFYGGGTDTINGIATATGISVAAYDTEVCYLLSATAWYCG